MLPTMRPYQATDLPPLQALVLDTPGPYRTYPTAAELPELLDPAVSNNPAHTVVWEAGDGNLVGFALVTHWNMLLYHFYPAALSDAVEAHMLAWALACRRALPTAAGEPPTLGAASPDDDVARVSLLRRLGFAPNGDTVLRMARSLEQPLPAPELPAGFTLRPLAGADEVDAYVALHRAAFGTQQMTAATRRALMRSSAYRPDLDLVAVASDGTLAGFCVCGIDEADNSRSGAAIGDINIVGTDPTYQRQGLGGALVLAGCRALQRHGMRTAVLSTAGDNAGAQRVYLGAGFHVAFMVRFYSRELDRIDAERLADSVPRACFTTTSRWTALLSSTSEHTET